MMFKNKLHYEPREGELHKVFERSSQPRTLDLGSGQVAAWCIAMADRFPQVEVIGIDLVPVELSYLPPNLSAEIGDLLDGLPFPDDFFSLIHCRTGISASFLQNPNRDFLGDVARCLSPGGVFLVEDIEDMRVLIHSTIPNNPYLDLARGRNSIRIDPILVHQPEVRARSDWGARMGDILRERDDFEHVEERTLDIPIGHDPKLGPLATQVGPIVREALLVAWEVQGAALGLSEATLSELREVDEQSLPREDVDLVARYKVVWAVKKDPLATATDG